MWSFFRRYPTPQHLLDEKDHSNVLDLIKPLGLGKKRTTILRKFSDEYLQKEVSVFQGWNHCFNCNVIAVFVIVVFVHFKLLLKWHIVLPFLVH